MIYLHKLPSHTCMMARLWLVCWSILLLAACRPASTPAATQDKVIAFVNGTLVDGTGANPVTDAVLLVQGEYWSWMATRRKTCKG